jgi:GNAT superfamily N-acetyltransferase
MHRLCLADESSKSHETVVPGVAGWNMVIREAIESDLKGMRLLYQQLNPADSLLAVDELRKPWLELLSSRLVHCFVAEIDGQLVSTCTLVIVPNLSRSAKSYAFIENVVTHEAHRCRGLGTAILKAALNMAWHRGCLQSDVNDGFRQRADAKVL